MAEKTILIVDDEPRNLEVLVNFLQELKYTILMTNNATKAYEITVKHLPDVVITDWEMPQVTGIELVKNLKANKETSDIPVIICTGVMISSENLKTALDAGAVDFIRKPIDFLELTARLNSTLRLSESLKKIKQLNTNKDRMFEIIAHDLTGPVGHIYTILNPEIISLLDNKQYIEFLVTARQSIHSTYNLLQNLLAWARSQRNKLEFAPEIQDINEVIQDIIDLLGANANNKKINLIWNEKANNLVFFDRNMIHTVIRNLVANAIKFTDNNGKITISTEKNSENFFFKISDTGVGISKENLTKINNKIPFTNFGTKQEKGSGLGMQLCHEFIQKHNGKLQVESKLDEGSTFTFSIPMKLIK